jgi:LexA-binding, inner membrane-associated putative hydrolase
MPSPIGHAVAGVLTAWIADIVPGRRAWRAAPATASWLDRAGDGLTIACAALAAAPDLDLLFAGHRTVTHSIGAVMLVGIVVALVAVQSGLPTLRVALMCAAAYASHLLLDWLAVDQTVPRGLQAFWPLSHRWYISGWNLFRATERRRIFTGTVMRLNAATIAYELAILLPCVAVAWLIRVKTLARFAAQVSCRDHAPQ